MPRVTKQQKAERFSVALRTTTARYVAGFMVKATWKKHMRALWGQVAEQGLQQLVQVELNRRARGKFSRRLDEIETCREAKRRHR